MLGQALFFDQTEHASRRSEAERSLHLGAVDAMLALLGGGASESAETRAWLDNGGVVADDGSDAVSYHAAAALCTSVLASDPSDAAALARRAQCALARGESARASADAAALRPSDRAASARLAAAARRVARAADAAVAPTYARAFRSLDARNAPVPAHVRVARWLYYRARFLLGRLQRALRRLLA